MKKLKFVFLSLAVIALVLLVILYINFRMTRFDILNETSDFTDRMWRMMTYYGRDHDFEERKVTAEELVGKINTVMPCEEALERIRAAGNTEELNAVMYDEEYNFSANGLLYTIALINKLEAFSVKRKMIMFITALLFSGFLILMFIMFRKPDKNQKPEKG